MAFFSDPKHPVPIELFARSLPRLSEPLALIFRHDQLPGEERLLLSDNVRAAVQDRGHLFIMARGALAAADGHHGCIGAQGIQTMPVHDEEELHAAKGADAVFISPVFATTSHPGTAPLGVERASQLAAKSPCARFALGGVDEGKAKLLEGSPFQGFGAIDAFWQ